MKSFVLIAVLLTAFTFSSKAQIRTKAQVSKANVLKEVRSIAPTFSRSEQAEIKQILGKDFVPVFSKNGELSIATPKSVKHVRALGGGFAKNPGSVANNILIHKGWVFASSRAVLEAMKSKLGAERFGQLEAIVGN